MNDKFFLKKSYLFFAVSIYIGMAYGIISLLLFLTVVRFQQTFLICSGIFLFITVLMVVSLKLNAAGLYIDGRKVYYKNGAVRTIDVNDIVGIKVIQAYGCGGKYRGFYPLTSKGAPLYTAVILKEIVPTMYDYAKGDLWFNAEFKDQIICSVIYDKNAIDFLKGLNSTIEII